MPTTFQFSPSAGSKISVSISSAMTEIKGAEGVPDFGPSAASYEVTAISDASKQYGKDIPDPGKIKITGIWDSMDPGQAYLLTASTTANQVDSFQVDFAKKQSATTPAKATFSGVVLSFQVAAAQKKGQMFTSEIQLSGAVTFTAAA